MEVADSYAFRQLSNLVIYASSVAMIVNGGAHGGRGLLLKLRQAGAGIRETMNYLIAILSPRTRLLGEVSKPGTSSAQI